jgi:hypothetical protein
MSILNIELVTYIPTNKPFQFLICKQRTSPGLTWHTRFRTVIRRTSRNPLSLNEAKMKKDESVCPQRKQ